MGDGCGCGVSAGGSPRHCCTEMASQITIRKRIVAIMGPLYNATGSLCKGLAATGSGRQATGSGLLTVSGQILSSACPSDHCHFGPQRPPAQAREGRLRPSPSSPDPTSPQIRPAPLYLTGAALPV